MKLDEKKFLHVMEFIEASDVSGASFDDSIDNLNATYPTMEPGKGTTEEKIGMSISERDFLLRHMRENNLVKGSFFKNGVSNLHLTYQGHSWLQEYRNNTLPKRALRWAARQTDKIFSSIFLPVVAAIVTVLVMQYLEISPDKPVEIEMEAEQ
ncbi:hypothetical protein FEE96_01715 [Parasedimentitalea maritima]|uniref:Uncharacterized protein n=1 Tax=Parasedimentitalea maritima TaxID=2578117 RepID=A0ABY2V5L0_9RHOB|nr:hypothetical protein [Zongyanglinia marina]TLP69029.1 hypothetical protein FEE96_01715 [Zongyanglinia marina]